MLVEWGWQVKAHLVIVLPMEGKMDMQKFVGSLTWDEKNELKELLNASTDDNLTNREERLWLQHEGTSRMTAVKSYSERMHISNRQALQVFKDWFKDSAYSD